MVERFVGLDLAMFWSGVPVFLVFVMRIGLPHYRHFFVLFVWGPVFVKLPRLDGLIF